MSQGSASYALSEIAVNNGKNGKPVWLIIKGDVYDVTSFLSEHPGGKDLILDNGGRDATKAFNEAGHSMDTIRDLKKYKIGAVAKQSQSPSSPDDCVNQTKFMSQPSCQSTKANKSEKRRRIKLFFCS